MVPTLEKRADWRKRFDERSFSSAIDEYCPSEFEKLLDAVDELEQQKARLHETLKGLFALVESLEDIEHNQFGCDDPDCVVCQTRNLLAEIDSSPAGQPAPESKPAILPCPFCGQSPDINNPATFVSDQGHKWGHIVCCCAGPEVRTGYKPLEHWKQDAISAWNERV